MNEQACDPVKLAQDILPVARNFILQCGVTHVPICQLSHRVVSRGKQLGCTVRRPLRGNYNALVDEVKQEIKRLVDFFPCIHFWKHRCMRLNWCALLHDNGVHLGAAGENFYYRSISGAILYLAKL